MIHQTAELPEEAQAELFEALAQMRGQYHDIYHLDDDERAALARSEEDVRLGRFASEDEVAATLARYRA